jgi:hypothetical protein
MTARTIIAKQVAFLFVQILSVRMYKIYIMYGYFYSVPAKIFVCFFGIVFEIPKSTSINSAFDTLDMERKLQIRYVPT